MSTPRTYDSRARDEAARATRRRVLDAARERFLADGYHATAMTSIARAAGVSPQTVYNSVGGKAAVLKAVYDVVLVGDDEPVPWNDRPEIAAVRSQDSAEGTLRAYAAAAAVLLGRLAPLLGVVLAKGAGSDDELAGFLATVDGERRIGNGGVVHLVADRFGLRPGLTAERALDITWTLTSPQVADLLVRQCGWSLAEYEVWLGDALVAALCRPPG